MGPRAVVVGPPGAGKTTVGELLAERLELPFRDTDADVVRTAGKPIADIFTGEGEPVFRELEERAVATALAEHDGVLSLGGGAVLSARTRALLADQPVVFLSVGLAEGARRTGLSTARPLLAGVNPRATFKALLDQRLPLYREVATWELVTDHVEPEALVDQLVERIAERHAHSGNGPE
ncbi:shikimate kinase [Saccharopolyspora taberi]|uniref:Shikimate kinase n=1 Tax=Saccharopolyspora taberi TaxID=60895 RepID=A0ABN3VGC7_9PSEU